MLKKNFKTIKQSQAFSLIELSIVILIIRDNGAVVSSNASATSTISMTSTYDLRIGWVGPEYDQARFSGYIGEIIIYTRGLKIDEIRDIEAYLSKKWSIKVS